MRVKSHNFINSQPPANHHTPHRHPQPPARTRVRVARPDRINFDVRPPGGEKLLVDEGPPAADGARVVGQVLGRAVVDLRGEGGRLGAA